MNINWQHLLIYILFVFNLEHVLAQAEKDSLLKRDFHLFKADLIRLSEQKMTEVRQNEKGILTKKIRNKDALMLLEITNKYGYLSNVRVNKITGDNINIEKLNLHLLFQCFPEKYKKAAHLLLTTEYKNGNIKSCEFGFLKMDLLNIQDYSILEEYGIVITEEIINDKSMYNRFKCLDDSYFRK